jgi:hypothetical protein
MLLADHMSSGWWTNHLKMLSTCDLLGQGGRNPHPRATGVTTSMVETMEERFKKDVLRELRQGNGRILLHDEVEDRPGVFSIIPIWETVSEDDILTPRDVFILMAKEGYKVILVEATRRHS